MASNEIVTKFTAEVADFQRKMTQIHKELDGTGKKADGAGAMFKKFSSAIKSNIGHIAAGVGAVVGMVAAINDMTKAYKQQEEADVKLQAAIRATGGDVEQLTAQYKAYASGIQEVTTYGDEVVQNLIAQAKYMGVADDKIKEATEGAIGLSEAFGIDTNTALKGVANAFEGNFSQLERYIPALRSASTEAEKQAILQKSMADGFKLAEEKAKSNTGQIDQLNNSLGDLKEALGAEIISNIVPFAGWLKTIADNATKALTETKAFAEYLKTGVSSNSMEGINAQIEGAKRRIDSLKLSVDAFGEVTNPAALKEAEAALYELEKKRTALRRSGENKQRDATLQAQIEAEKKAEEERQRILEEQERIKAEELAAEVEHIDAMLKESNRYWKTKQEEKELFQAALDERTEREEAADIARAERLDAEKEATREHFEALTEYYNDYASRVTDTFAALGERLGESIVEQESMWDATGQIIRDAIAGIIRALGSEAFVEAAKNAAKAFAALANPITAPLAGGYFAAAAKWTGVGTLASVTAGAVTAKFATGSGGAFTVPEGFQNDSFPIGVSSGEQVFVKNITQQMNSGGNMFHIVAKIGEKVIIDTVQEAYDNRKLILVEAV